MRRITFIFMSFAAIGLVIILKPVADFITDLTSNLTWYASQPPLSSTEYPLGVFSTPGGGLLLVGVLLVIMIGGGIFFSILARRPR